MARRGELDLEAVMGKALRFPQDLIGGCREDLVSGRLAHEDRLCLGIAPRLGGDAA